MMSCFDYNHTSCSVSLSKHVHSAVWHCKAHLRMIDAVEIQKRLQAGVTYAFH